jgi:hypothetical protein
MFTVWPGTGVEEAGHSRLRSLHHQAWPLIKGILHRGASATSALAGDLFGPAEQQLEVPRNPGVVRGVEAGVAQPCQGGQMQEP